MAKSPAAFLLLAFAGGCTCRGNASGGSSDGGAAAAAASSISAVAEAAAASAPATWGDVFSAPIAAARTPTGTVVAGLVASEGTIRVAALRDADRLEGAKCDGATCTGATPAWVVDALRGVSWAADADVHVHPAGDGVAVVWRGQYGGKMSRTLVVLGPAGELRGDPAEIGAAYCANADGISWIDVRSGAPALVRARRWSDSSPHDVVAVSSDRDPSLVCGDHAAFVLGDGDEDVTAAAFGPADSAARPPVVAIRNADFGEDDERDHYPWSAADRLGIVRVGASGGLRVREWQAGATPTPWRRLKHTLAEDDDVVAVDGDDTATLVVYTHDADEACPGVGSTAEAVRALRVDRQSGEDMLVDLAPADCDHSPGPFWVAPSAQGLAVAWVNRGTKLPPKSASITGIAYRTLAPDGVRAGHADQAADAFVDGGCDKTGCSAAALLRPPGADGMAPEGIRVFAYP
jgi:hypothetical protein